MLFISIAAREAAELPQLREYGLDHAAARLGLADDLQGGGRI